MEKKIIVPQQELVHPLKIRPDETNPNILSKEGFAALKKNIEAYGFLIPVITNKDLVIADGYHRWKAGVELGMEQVPVLRLPLEEVDRHILRQVMNKLKGEHDKTKDLMEFQFIMDSEGMDKFKELLPQAVDYEELLKQTNADAGAKGEDSFDAEAAWKEPKYKVEFGDVWQLGQHRLMCGDSTKKADVDRLMDGQKADCLFMDPPYNLAFAGTTEGKFGSMQNDTLPQHVYGNFIGQIMESVQGASKAGCGMYICIDYRNYHRWINELEKRGIEILNCLVWDKVFAGLGYKYRFRHEFIIFAGDRDKVAWFGDGTQEDFFKLVRNEKMEDAQILDRKGFSLALSDNTYLRVKLEDDIPARVPLLEGKELRFRTQHATNTDVFEGFSMNYFSQREQEWSDGIVHPTMKPVRIITKILKNSTRREDLILDLCAGSGSTLIGAQQTERTAYCMEIEPRYCSVIIQRWETYTGEKPKKL